MRQSNNEKKSGKSLFYSLSSSSISPSISSSSSFCRLSEGLYWYPTKSITLQATSAFQTKDKKGDDSLDCPISTADDDFFVAELHRHGILFGSCKPSKLRGEGSQEPRNTQSVVRAR